jgi:hypothetical protein
MIIIIIKSHVVGHQSHEACMLSVEPDHQPLVTLKHAGFSLFTPLHATKPPSILKKEGQSTWKLPCWVTTTDRTLPW